MTTAYHRQDLIGWLARHILQGPETVFEYHKDFPDAPASRRGRHLPPRLSLRAQASKRVSIGVLESSATVTPTLMFASSSSLKMTEHTC